jgi:DNA-binding transcriptional ArsR family regulator
MTKGAVRGVLTIERPVQLKALGHPLRLRVLEMLGGENEEALTNRDLARRLGVDPGHLHFHVRMLVRAGLIEPAEGGQGREKPYRTVARTIRISPELRAAAGSAQAAMLDEVQRGFAAHAGQGSFRSAQVTARVAPEKVQQLMREFFEGLRVSEEPEGTQSGIVVTVTFHPPAPPA